MFKFITSIAIFTISTLGSVNAQNLRFSAGAGIALGETRFVKKNMVCSEYSLGYETIMKKGYQISASAGLSGVSFDFYDSSLNSVYQENTFITVPVVLRKQIKTFNLKKSSYYFGIGLAGSWCFKDKKTIKNYPNSSTTAENFTGFNLSMCMEIGQQIFVSKKSSVSLSLIPQIDILTNYSNSVNKIRFLKNLFTVAYSINLGNTN